MSVRHIDFIKIKPSKCLMVEIQPLRCYIPTSGGVTKTAKWMSYEHWKELHLLLRDVITSYEESERIGSSLQADCHETKMKDGHLIKIGYMFMVRNTFKCHLIRPRDGATWTDDDEDYDEEEEEEGQKPRDRDCRYGALIPCEERLVVSVQLKKQHSIPRKDKTHCQALDSSFVVINTFPDHIPSTEANFVDSSLLLLQHGQNDLKRWIHKSHMRPKRLKSRILAQNSGFYFHQEDSVLDTASDDSSDQSQELLIRRFSQDAVHLCMNTVNQYPSYRKKYIHDNRHTESDQSSVQQCIKNCKNLSSDTLCEKCFGCNVKVEKYLDDNEMKTVNSRVVDSVDGSGKSKCISRLNLGGNCDIPNNYPSCGRGSSVDCASVSNNKELVIKSSLQCSQSNTFVNESLKEEHLISSQKNNSDNANENRGIGIVKNNLCETRDSSPTNTTSEVVTSILESIKKEDACDGDNNHDDNVSAFPKSSFLKSGNSDVAKSLPNLGCLEDLNKNVLPPIQKRASSQGRRKKNLEEKRKKMQQLFGNEGSITEQIEPKVLVKEEYPELSSGEYTPPLKKSLAAENVHSPFPDYTPSPIHRTPGSCERNASNMPNDIEHLDNDRLHCSDSTFGENKGEIYCRRSERLQDKMTKVIYDLNLIYPSDEMSDQDIKPDPDSKKNTSSENVNDSSHKVVGNRRRACSKRKKPVSNCTDVLNNNKDNQEHNCQSEDENKLPQKTTIGKRQKTVADAKNKQETRPRGRPKCGILESEKTRECKRVLREVMLEIEEAQKRRLEDCPLQVAVSETGLLNDNETSKWINKNRKSAECKKAVEGRKQATPRNVLVKENISSENVKISSQKVVGNRRRACRKKNEPISSCTDVLNNNNDNQEHNPQSEEKLPQKSTIGNIRGKAVNRRQKTVAGAKTKQETRQNRPRGRPKCGIFESEKTRECKRILREVMMEIEEARKRRLEDCPLQVAVSETGLLNDNDTSELINKNKKPAECKKVVTSRKPATPKNCHSKKLTDTIPKECQAEKLDEATSKGGQSKKCNSTPPKVCQSKKFTISALAKKQCQKNSSGNVKSAKVLKTLEEKRPQEHRKTTKRKSNKTPSIGICTDTSTAATSDWKSKEKQSSLSNEGMEIGNKDKLVSVLDESISGQESDHPSFMCIEEPQIESFVAGENSRNLTTPNPQMDHLSKCRSMLTKVPLSELSERLEQSHEYLRGIINEEIFNEKHKIFKEQGKACASLLNIGVYAVFQEEQSEFIIDLMRKKYFEKLHLAIKDRCMRSRYIMKVLVPCFFIKLTMDLLDVENEKQAEEKLMQICRTFAD
ncbi:uncharacterized protein LOC135216765 [Macrobrachium nipponense]|uniref:uncharacterized protein LOC135216765 n=1 Tax=Macrobrachium nipponense TaxID=159736 RepID=UPI0030C7DB41